MSFFSLNLIILYITCITYVENMVEVQKQILLNYYCYPTYIKTNFTINFKL